MKSSDQEEVRAHWIHFVGEEFKDRASRAGFLDPPRGQRSRRALAITVLLNAVIFETDFAVSCCTLYRPTSTCTRRK